jgi:hypothetical protein
MIRSTDLGNETAKDAVSVMENVELQPKSRTSDCAAVLRAAAVGGRTFEHWFANGYHFIKPMLINIPICWSITPALPMFAAGNLDSFGHKNDRKTLLIQ